jgi:hypothetical protein
LISTAPVLPASSQNSVTATRVVCPAVISKRAEPAQAKAIAMVLFACPRSAE